MGFKSRCPRGRQPSSHLPGLQLNPRPSLRGRDAPAPAGLSPLIWLQLYPDCSFPWTLSSSEGLIQNRNISGWETCVTIDQAKFIAISFSDSFAAGVILDGSYFLFFTTIFTTSMKWKNCNDFTTKRSKLGQSSTVTNIFQ